MSTLGIFTVSSFFEPVNNSYPNEDMTNAPANLNALDFNQKYALAVGHWVDTTEDNEYGFPKNDHCYRGEVITNFEFRTSGQPLVQ